MKMKHEIPFVLGLAHQKYLKAEDGIIDAHNSGCSHWYIDGSLHGEMIQDWDEQRLYSLKKQIQKLSCKPIFHGNFKAPLASDVKVFTDAAIEYVKKEIDICEKLQAPLIVHAGAVVEPKAILSVKDIGLNNFINSVRKLSEYAQSKGVDLYLENLSNYKHYRPFHYLFTNIDEYSKVFKQLSDCNNVYFFFDVGHSNIGNDNTLEVFEKFHNKIKGISLSNNNGQQDQHLPITMGELNYNDIIKSILKHKWQGLVAFETRGISTRDTLLELQKCYERVNEVQ